MPLGRRAAAPLPFAVVLAGVIAAVSAVWTASPSTPPTAIATLEPAPEIEFPAPADSNSPAWWAIERGRVRLFVLNSAPDALLSDGSRVDRLEPDAPARFTNMAAGGRWFEAVIPDGPARTLCGYYHYEPRHVCEPGSPKTSPRIGAAKSRDGGRTWVDLGIVLAAPPGTDVCDTPNKYFAGGVGDFSVVRDRDGVDLYFFYSAYARDQRDQGVAVGRLAWADRDDPVGRLAVWRDGVWVYPDRDDRGDPVFHAGTPIFPALRSWHRSDRRAAAYWGPSVHWNTHIEQYVMLLNRTADTDWNQQGIYVSYAETLDDPAKWSRPRSLLEGGFWYPQVIGLEAGIGTDKVAGRTARFFMSGRSAHTITFTRPGE